MPNTNILYLELNRLQCLVTFNMQQDEMRLWTLWTSDIELLQRMLIMVDYLAIARASRPLRMQIRQCARVYTNRGGYCIRSASMGRQGQARKGREMRQSMSSRNG